MVKKQDYYSLLGIPRNATPDEIRQAYFDAARRLHPDKNVAPGETELFLDVQEAYEVLANVKKRAKYDATLPPEKPPDYPLDHRILFSRPGFLNLDESQLIYVLFEFSYPADLEVPPSPPLNLCLVLDRSTSMQGGNMDTVKTTAIQIMHKLKPQDIFSVVAFSDRAEVVIPATRSEELNRQEARVQMLQTSGGTEIFSGLEAGYNEILRNASRSQVNHIILLTDGRTYGDEEKCRDLAHRAAELGIGISGLGIGAEWNDNFLDELASITGGSSMYISRPQDIQQALLEKFTCLGKTYAEDTRLEFVVPAGIELRYAFRLQPEAGLLSFESPLLMGPITRENNLKVLMEFIVKPSAAEKKVLTLMEGQVLARLSSSSSQGRPIPIQLVRPVNTSMDLEPPSAEIVDALSRLKLYRLQEQARLEVDSGNYDQAVEHLNRLATHLLARGERGLARTALMEADHIQRNKSLSQEGGKEIKYGTRALLTSGRRADPL